MVKIKEEWSAPAPTVLPAWDVVKKWKREILLFVLVSVSLGVIYLATVPKKYYSSATILPTNPTLTDKGRIFNNNIENLYSFYGTGDDLDRLYAMASTQTMYVFLADSFKLINSKTDAVAKAKVINKIRKSIELKKTSNGELVIGVWTKERELSANIANAIVRILERSGREMLANYYRSSLSYFEKIKSRDITDSSQMFSFNVDYRKAITEITTTIETAPPPLIVLDKAEPAVKAGKPKPFLLIFSVLIASLFFAVILVNIIERSKKDNSARSPSLI